MYPMINIPKAPLLLLFASVTNAWNSSLYSTSPAVYPSPNATGIGWEDALAKAQSLVSQLTLEEKVSLITGTPGPCVGTIPPIEGKFGGLCLQDGPLSIRLANYASVFPAGITVAATWDRDMMRRRGEALGQEFREKGSHNLLGPVCGPLGRSALGGRNWEGFSPDPYLTAISMSETIIGTQSVGVQATAKHFIAYEQETQRFETLTKDNTTTIEAYSSNVGDRTMHELYLYPFYDSVRAGVASVMCSYNRVNGTYGCQNSAILNGLLKTELGFQGYVMSDWLGTKSGTTSILAGLDMNQPGATIGKFWGHATPSYWGANLTVAVQNGSVPESRIDDAVTRVLTPYYYLGQDQDFPLVDPSSATLQADYPRDRWVYNLSSMLSSTANVDVRGNHKEMIREIGAAGTVLLKNVNNTLPLKSNLSTIGVFGNDAGDVNNYLYSLNSYGFEQGILGVGGGSGTGRFTYIVSPLEAIKNQVSGDGTLVQYILNNTQAYVDISSLNPTEPEACLVFLKTWASEATDRTSLDVDYNGNGVVETVAGNCSNTIVVTHSGGINNLPFADHPNVTAILAAHFPGQEAGNSIVDILWGKVNPSGKLPYTIALNASDYDFAHIVNITNATDPEAFQVDFTEELFIDYRYFDAQNLSVQYEFGFGLSYTTFEVSDLALENVYSGDLTAYPPAAKIIPGGNPRLYDELFTITATITNTGSLEGATTAQLYVYFPQSDTTVPSGTPLKQLRGFDKINLASGEAGEVSFTLTRRDLSFWDVVAQEWQLGTGEYKLGVGLSSRDINLFTTFNVL